VERSVAPRRSCFFNVTTPETLSQTRVRPVTVRHVDIRLRHERVTDNIRHNLYNCVPLVYTRT
jgi:hypothetical protein